MDARLIDPSYILRQNAKYAEMAGGITFLRMNRMKTIKEFQKSKDKEVDFIGFLATMNLFDGLIGINQRMQWV